MTVPGLEVTVFAVITFTLWLVFQPFYGTWALPVLLKLAVHISPLGTLWQGKVGLSAYGWVLRFGISSLLSDHGAYLESTLWVSRAWWQRALLLSPPSPPLPLSTSRPRASKRQKLGKALRLPGCTGLLLPAWLGRTKAVQTLLRGKEHKAWVDFSQDLKATLKGELSVTSWRPSLSQLWVPPLIWKQGSITDSQEA